MFAQVALIVLASAAAVAANSYGYNKPSYGHHGYSAAPAYKPAAYSSYKADDYSVSLNLLATFNGKRRE